MARQRAFPIRMGWVALLQSDPAFELRSGVNYRGLDRMQYGANPAEVAAAREGRRAAWAAAWNGYWSVFTGDQALPQDYRTVEGVCRALSTVGVLVEPVLYDVVWMLRSEADTGLVEYGDVREMLRFLDMHDRPHARQRGRDDVELRSLGYDVTRAMPTFHSAILQPAFAGEDPAWRAMLNPAGLLNDIETAKLWACFADRQGSAGLPFCVVEVFESLAWDASSLKA